MGSKSNPLVAVGINNRGVPMNPWAYHFNFMARNTLSLLCSGVSIFFVVILGVLYNLLVASEDYIN